LRNPNLIPDKEKILEWLNQKNLKSIQCQMPATPDLKLLADRFGKTTYGEE